MKHDLIAGIKKHLAASMPLIALAMVVVLFTVSLKDIHVGDKDNSPLVGQAVPLNLAGIRGPYVIDFFASWCMPCLVEHPVLMKMHANGVKIIGIAYKDSKADVDAFLEKNGNPYQRIFADPKGILGVSMGITGVPESFAVDAQGIIRKSRQGPLTSVDDLNHD